MLIILLINLKTQRYSVIPNSNYDGSWLVETINATLVKTGLNGNSDGLRLNGAQGDDEIIGSAYNDIIDGGTGDDTIIANTGNDTIRGGAGNNTIVFNKKDGFDRIYSDLGTDTIKFADLSERDKFKLTTQNNDLVINYSENGSVVVDNYLSNPYHSVKYIQIKNGAKTTIQEFLSKNTPTLTGSGGEYDNVQGSDLGEIIKVNGTKNMVIHPNRGNDVVDVTTDSECDVQIYWNKGDGNLDIKGYYYDLNDTSKNTNLTFLADDASNPFENVSRKKSGNDLIIERENGETLTIENYFKDDGSYNYSDTNLVQGILDVYPDDNAIITGTSQQSAITQYNYHSANGKNIMKFSKVPNVEYKVYSGSDNVMDEIQIPIYSPSGSDINFKKDGDDLVIEYKCDKNLAWIDNTTKVRLIAYYSDSHTTLDCVTYQNNLYNGLLSQEPAVNTISYGSADSDKTLTSNIDSITIKAGLGDDTITTYAVQSFLYGEKGNDTLVGTTQGQDNFCFSLGDGSDTINGGILGGADDSIIFLNLNSDNIITSLNNNDLIINYTNSDNITIVDYMKNGVFPIYVANDENITNSEKNLYETLLTVLKETNYSKRTQKQKQLFC